MKGRTRREWLKKLLLDRIDKKEQMRNLKNKGQYEAVFGYNEAKIICKLEKYKYIEDLNAN